MLGFRTKRHIFEGSSVIGLYNCVEILLPNMGLKHYGSSVPFHVWQYAMSSHCNYQRLLESEDIEYIDWPARSPNMNPIEHVWDFRGRHMTSRILLPVTIPEVRLVLQEDCTTIPQQYTYNLLLSKTRRCWTYIVVREDHIPLPKTECFLLATCPMDDFAFSRIVLHVTLSIKFLYILFIFLKVCLHYECLGVLIA